MRQFKDFAPDPRGKWGASETLRKKRKKKKSKQQQHNTSIKYYVTKDQIQSPSKMFRENLVTVLSHDPTTLHLEQHARPDSVAEHQEPRPFYGYSTATTISELKKEARHSRRFLAIEGDTSIAGRRRLRQPTPIDRSTAPEDTPHLSTTSDSATTAAAAAATATTAAAADTTAAAADRMPASFSSIEHHAQRTTTKLPPPSLSTAFLRLHGSSSDSKNLQQKQQQQWQQRTTALPRDDVRGALKLPELPKWKQVYGAQRNIATPLAFPTSSTSRERFDDELIKWEELSRHRIIAREQNKKQMSYLVANHQTYIERVEYAREYYRNTTKRYSLRKWWRHCRWLKGRKRVEEWRLDMLQRWGLRPWKSFCKEAGERRNKSRIKIQQWWKQTESKRRYVRQIDLSTLTKQIMLVPPPTPEKKLNHWQKKLRGLMIASVVGLFIWGGDRFCENWFLERVRRSLMRWHLWSKRETTIRRHLFFTSRASHGQMCSEIKRHAARARQRRRRYAALVIQCGRRCYNSRTLLVRMKKLHRRMVLICAKFGMATNGSLLSLNFFGWKRVATVERTMGNFFRRQCGELLGKVLYAWANEGMKQVRIDKIRAATIIQAVHRGRSARERIDVIKRRSEFDQAAAERRRIRMMLMANQKGGDGMLDDEIARNDTTTVHHQRGYFSDSTSSDDEEEEREKLRRTRQKKRQKKKTKEQGDDLKEKREVVEEEEEEEEEEVVDLHVVEEFGQDMTTLKSLVARYVLTREEIERMTTTLARFDEMYKQAREYVMELGYEMKDLRQISANMRHVLKKHQEMIRTIERKRTNLSRIRNRTDEDLKLDLKLSKRLKQGRKEEDRQLKNIHEIEDKEKRLQSQYAEEHRAMSDEKQNSAVYFDTSALSWNTNDDAGEKNQEESGMVTTSTPTTQRFPMRTSKQREFLEAALRQGLLNVGESIYVERKRLKVESRVLRRKQRALERECLQQLLWLSVGNEKEEAERGRQQQQGAGVGSGGGGGGGSQRRSRMSKSTSHSFKFTRMLSDIDPKKTEAKVRSACIEWRSMVENGWLPPTKIAAWISGGLLEPSIPLRSRVVAFRCVREVFGEHDQVMAEIAYAISKKENNEETSGN